MRVLLLAAIAAGSALCQQVQIAGLIRDPAGLNVSGAEVSVRNEQTGGRRQTRTNDSGFYSVASLNPGTYRILIRREGFETIVREGVTLAVGDNARLDFTLRIGDSRTIVTVRGGPPLMNTEDASIGTVIGRDFIDEMPLNGRGIQSLIELAPGVEATPTSPDNSGQFSVNGQRSVANYFTVDGVTANFGAASFATLYYPGAGINISQAGGAQLPATNVMGTFSNLVSPDALQEFRIQTSTFAPEFGRAPGAQFGFITRSGTNRYSGSLFEYFRNDVFDANDWFSDLDGLRKSPLRFNNFGGSLGGPIRFPHLYRGDDHTFFFFSFENLVMRQPQATQSFALPTAQTRLLASPLSAPFYNVLPLPNLPASTVNAGPGWAGFAQGFSMPIDQPTWSLRIDHYFGNKLIGFFRYNLAPSNQTQELPGLPLTGFRYAANTVAITAGLTQSISPTLVNDLRANVSWQSVTNNAELLFGNGEKPFPASLFFPEGYSPQDSNITVYDDSTSSLPIIYFGFEGGSRSHQIQTVDQFSYTRARHQFKFGLDYRSFNLRYTPPQTQSTYVFSDLPDGLVDDVAVQIQQGDHAYRVPAFSLYAQDTWHALRRLTITYGLRWELEPSPRPASTAIATYRLSSVTDLSSLVSEPQGTPFYPTRYSNFAPRIGVAWQMSDRGNRKTVLRGGVGVFYDSGQSGFENTYLNTIYNDGLNFPLGTLPSAASTSHFGMADPVVAAPGYTLPRAYEWNATLEQSFGAQTISASYVGAVGRRLLGTAYDNRFPQYPIVPLPADLGGIFIVGNYFSSSYNALQLQFSRRAGKRVRAMVSYTWSHSIDNLSAQGGGPAPSLDSGLFLDPNLNRGDSDFDVRQSLHGALLVALPAPRGGPARVLLRNWTASTIFFVRTSLPTDLVIFNKDGAGLRPDLVAGLPLYLYGSGYPGGKSFNPAAFTVPPEGVAVGDLGRNTLRLFGAWQADLALHREFRLTEHATMQFRSEAFNVFNHPNFFNPSSGGVLSQQDVAFGGPNWNISQATLAAGLSPLGTLGQLNRLFQVGGPRTLQLALRLTF